MSLLTVTTPLNSRLSYRPPLPHLPLEVELKMPEQNPPFLPTSLLPHLRKSNSVFSMALSSLSLSPFLSNHPISPIRKMKPLLTPATYLAGPKLPSSFLSQNSFIAIFTCFTAHHLKCTIHEFLGSHRYMQSLPVSFRTSHHCKQTMYPVAIILYAQPP